MDEYYGWAGLWWWRISGGVFPEETALRDGELACLHFESIAINLPVGNGFTAWLMGWDFVLNGDGGKDCSLPETYSGDPEFGGVMLGLT